MKVKKLLALVLSALMAVTMLTACGGGSGAGKTVSIDRSEVEEIFAEMGYDVDVKTSNAATAIAKQTAAWIEEVNYATAVEQVTTEVGNNFPTDAVGGCSFIAKADLEAQDAPVEGVAALAIAYCYTGEAGSDIGVSVVEVNTADNVTCYLGVAVVQ